MGVDDLYSDLFLVGSRRFGLGERRVGVASPGDVRAVGKRARGAFCKITLIQTLCIDALYVP
jgi:hypothetical protein